MSENKDLDNLQDYILRTNQLLENILEWADFRENSIEFINRFDTSVVKDSIEHLASMKPLVDLAEIQSQAIHDFADYLIKIKRYDRNDASTFRIRMYADRVLRRANKCKT